MRRFSRSVFLAASLAYSGLSFGAVATGKAAMKNLVNEVYRQFDEMYAPREWKAEQFGLNLAEEKDRLLAKVEGGLSVQEFQVELGKFFASTRDYHVGVYFTSTAYSFLPFTLAATEDGFVVSDVFRTLAPHGAFPFNPGDKIDSFNGVDINTIAAKLSGGVPTNRKETDDAITAMNLTFRNGMRGDAIGEGAVVVKGTSMSGAPLMGETIWYSNREEMTYPTAPSFTQGGDLGPSRDLFNLTEDDIRRDPEGAMRLFTQKVERNDSVAFSKLFAKSKFHKESNYDLGHREGFLPQLGHNILWETPQTDEFYAYIYENEHRQRVGVVRIPGYYPQRVGSFREAVAQFGNIMAKMNSMADVLVVDQTNNPGGAVFYLYALASYFTDTPLTTPMERFTIDAYAAWDAIEMLKIMDMFIMFAAFGVDFGDIQGYPVDANFLLHMKSYFQFIVDQWEAGKTLTDPYFLYGVNYIPPSAGARFTKPTLLLTNRLDFSGGDFFPAILQDNKKVTIMGENTAGAGGYVMGQMSMNQLGVLYYSLTGSIAVRANGQPIENLGVTPDIPYTIGRADISSGFFPFAEAVRAEVAKMLAGQATVPAH